MKTTCIFSFLILIANIANSAPLKNYSGLINIPSAYTIGSKVLEITGAMDIYQTIDKKFKQEIDVRVSLGIERMELGFTFLTEKLYCGSFKLNFISEDENGWVPAVAWGIRGINGDSRITSTGTDSPYTKPQNNAVYVVMSKKFAFETTTPTIHFGIGSEGFKADTDTLKRLEGIFFGWELPLTFADTNLRNVSILGEFDGKHLNMGAKWVFRTFTFVFAVSSINRLYPTYTNVNYTYGEAEGFRIGAAITISSKSLGLW